MFIDQSERRVLKGLTQKVLPLPQGEFILNKFDPGAILPQHFHEHIQFGFAIDGEFDLVVGAKQAKHTVKDQQGFLLGPNVPHGAMQLQNRSIFTFDLKQLLPQDSSFSYPDISFHEPESKQFSWGKSLTYTLPWCKCQYLQVRQHQHAEIHGESELCYIGVIENTSYDFSDLFKLKPPLILGSDHSDLHVVVML